MRRTPFYLGFCLLACAAAAHAALVYDFSYTAASGPVQSFSFSIPSPTFIAPGPLTFTPFEVTDGTNLWSFSNGDAVEVGVGCMAFGTASVVIGMCSGGWGAGEDVGFLSDFWFGGLPTAEGLYVPDVFSGIFYAGGTPVTLGPGTGSMQLNITQAPVIPEAVPEPGGIVLLATGLALGVLRRRRSLRP